MRHFSLWASRDLRGSAPSWCGGGALRRRRDAALCQCRASAARCETTAFGLRIERSSMRLCVCWPFGPGGIPRWQAVDGATGAASRTRRRPLLLRASAGRASAPPCGVPRATMDSRRTQYTRLCCCTSRKPSCSDSLLTLGEIGNRRARRDAPFFKQISQRCPLSPYRHGPDQWIFTEQHHGQGVLLPGCRINQMHALAQARTRPLIPAGQHEPVAGYKREPTWTGQARTLASRAADHQNVRAQDRLQFELEGPKVGRAIAESTHRPARLPN